MKILAFESTCDETAVAVVEDGRKILTDQIFSQAKLHAVYGGVVPEIASRCHVESISILSQRALEAAGKHTVRDVSKMVVEIPYTLLGKLQNLEKNEPFMIEDAIYTDAVTLHLSMNLEDENRVEALLMEVSAGNAKILETSQICC